MTDFSRFRHLAKNSRPRSREKSTPTIGSISFVFAKVSIELSSLVVTTAMESEKDSPRTMKITCDSCGSKYTIADAKVKGRKVKVRCKGCKESILVDGTQLDGTEGDDTDDADSVDDAVNLASDKDASPAAAADVPKKDKNLWSVNLTDDDSRDMTLNELIAGWKSGLVTSDAYVWKDGMGDWKPILEVGELKLKLGPSPKKATPGVVSSSAGGAAPIAAKAAHKMDDLFGGADFAGDGPSEAEKHGGGFGAEAKPTGARNDSSVLFSLDSLNAGAETGSKQKADAIDLFGNMGTSGPMLTNNADLLTAPAKAPPPAPAGARVVSPAPEPAKGKGGIIIAILGAAVIIGAVLFFTVGGSGDEATAEDPTAVAAQEAEAKKAEEERKKAEAERATMAAELKKMQDELKQARDEATEKGEDPEAAAAKKQAELDKAKTEAEAEAKAAAEKSASTKAGSTSTGKTDSSSAKPAPAAEPKPASGGAAFDVGAAKAALAAASANAAACKQPGGPTGPGKVQVIFSPSGRVTSATVVTGPFGGTPVGGCIASTFRRARVPPFSGDAQTVAKSFTVP